jgi:hypothetical protein
VELRELNQDFINLAAQTNRLDTESQISLSPKATSLVSSWTEQKSEECKMVQRASTQLCVAMENACLIHTEHTAHFRLDPKHVGVHDSNQTLVRFHMAFAHASTLPEPVWITVDSIFNESNLRLPRDEAVLQHAPNALTGLSNASKHGLPSSTSSRSSKKSKKKSVRFTASVAPSNSSPGTILTTTIFTNTTLPDFCLAHDFCRQLKQRSLGTPENKYIGYFEKKGPCKHLVCFAPPITNARSAKENISLAKILSNKSSKGSEVRFLEYEVLSLARQLASAVLLFHPTPVLKASWRSNDIVFFGSSSPIISLAHPHLTVELCSPKSAHPRLHQKKDTSLTRNSTVEGQGYIRNMYLFNLGVVLLELAYQTPLQSLRASSDLNNGSESRHTDFFVADRLSKTMATSLGVRYAKIVRKCLGCDFGEGTTDLEDANLQAAFYSDVVCELERLERTFTLMQLDD